MMKILAKNEFVEVVYEPSRLFFKHTWYNTNQMNDKKYRELVEFVNNLYDDIETRYHLVDTSQFQFTIAPATQVWIAERVFPKILEKGVEKIAFLVSKDVFAQVSIEQFVEENKVAPVQTRYFEDENSALEWLFKIE